MPVPHLVPRQNNPNDGSMNISPVFVVIGALIVTVVFLSIGGFLFGWRRRMRNAGYPESNIPLGSARRSTRRPRKPKNVLTKEKLDEMFPAIPYSEFLEQYYASDKLRDCDSVYSLKPQEDGSSVEDGDMGSLQIRREPKIICAICQQFIGHEDQNDLAESAEPQPQVSETAPSNSTPSHDTPSQDTPSQDTSTQEASTATDDEDEELASPVIPVQIIESGAHVPVRLLSCDHVFHDQCIMPWLTTQKASCPLCQQQFGKVEEPKPEESETSTEPVNTP